ncbi:hypothetical protein WJX84_002121 [Apatococcus fuscideae]|uniref:Oligopeptide transporter n=1 Tax=Apatococcus fuscideae TaxID=2026836 RepID=A0AAW1TBG6_9CHLO
MGFVGGGLGGGTAVALGGRGRRAQRGSGAGGRAAAAGGARGTGRGARGAGGGLGLGAGPPPWVSRLGTESGIAVAWWVSSQHWASCSRAQAILGGAVTLSFGQLILWSLSLAFIGVFCAVPLRTQTIIKEKLTFPSGTATANVIRTLHGMPQQESSSKRPRGPAPGCIPEEGAEEQNGLLADGDEGGEERPLLPPGQAGSPYKQSYPGTPVLGRLHSGAARQLSRDFPTRTLSGPGALQHELSGRQAGSGVPPPAIELTRRSSSERFGGLPSIKSHVLLSSWLEPDRGPDNGESTDWSLTWTTLLGSFGLAGSYTMLSGFVKQLKEFPVLSLVGWDSATAWGWVLSPSFGYIGQGMIMGPRTAWSMLAGALLGWAWLGPAARQKGWAPGPITKQTGAAGWILWVSLAIMLGDSLTSLSILMCTSTWRIIQRQRNEKSNRALQQETEDPCPPENRVPTYWWVAGLVASAAFCTAVLVPMMGMPLYEPLAAVILALLVAVLAVRALGETDLNPVSGVGKLSQLIFAVVAPGNVVSNLVAGAIAEAGAQQAGDMMQDFKTAHLLGVCPRSQFYAMLLGSGASVLLSVCAYSLYTYAWVVPGPELPAPTAGIWLDMAELVNNGHLPPHVVPYCLVGAVLAALLPIGAYLMQASGNVEGSQSGTSRNPGTRWHLRVLQVWKAVAPSGIGIAVGMYVAPKFTIPRVLGSIIEQVWLQLHPNSHGRLMVVVASGLVLGEGTAASFTAVIQAFRAHPS